VHWSFLENLPLSLITALVWALLAFLVGRIVKRHATIDVFWGAGFLVVYLESLLVVRHVTFPPGFKGAVIAPGFADRYLVLAAVALWGLRLSIHLALRQRGSREDSRYVAILMGARGRHETLYALKMIYGLQGLILWCVSMPLQWIAFHERFNALLYVGLGLVAIGIFFEATGDEQLRRFIANPSPELLRRRRGVVRVLRGRLLRGLGRDHHPLAGRDALAPHVALGQADARTQADRDPRRLRRVRGNHQLLLPLAAQGVLNAQFEKQP
jgi:steroid 5-alpha reductase family enzyme